VVRPVEARDVAAAAAVPLPFADDRAHAVRQDPRIEGLDGVDKLAGPDIQPDEDLVLIDVAVLGEAEAPVTAIEEKLTGVRV
jgi:hypothetical protein